jgi:hypothetical protein
MVSRHVVVSGSFKPKLMSTRYSTIQVCIHWRDRSSYTKAPYSHFGNLKLLLTLLPLLEETSDKYGGARAVLVRAFPCGPVII